MPRGDPVQCPYCHQPYRKFAARTVYRTYSQSDHIERIRQCYNPECERLTLTKETITTWQSEKEFLRLKSCPELTTVDTDSVQPVD